MRFQSMKEVSPLSYFLDLIFHLIRFRFIRFCLLSLICNVPSAELSEAMKKAARSLEIHYAVKGIKIEILFD